ncbi:hypothetical protein UlMin_024007 [Ulmus minor]
MEIGSRGCCLSKQVPYFFWSSRTLGWENVVQLPYDITPLNLRMSHQKLTLCQPLTRKHPKNYVSWRAHCVPMCLGVSSSLQSEDHPNDNELASDDSPDELLAQPLSSDQLKSLLADSERTKLIKKLSEANQQNRFLKRQLHIKEEALVNFKSKIALMELEIQALVKLAEEIATAIPEGSRKINGKYIQSHLLSRLEAILEKLKEQIKDVDTAQSKEVSLAWVGMAECVQVMGTFDGWSQGEHLSPEYTGSFTKFSTTIMLRPGRYEIKFLVDGEWQLSPEFPIVGEGLMKNNLLIVE